MAKHIFRNNLPKFWAITGALFLSCLLPPAPMLAQDFEVTTTWVGNTFGGGKNWVQNYMLGLQVDPDGTCYTTSIWDEGHREYGIYKDGQVIGNKDVKVNSRRCLDKQGKTWQIENFWGRFFDSDNIAPEPVNKPVVKCEDGRVITDVIDPTALCIDNQGRLMVAENGPDQNLRIYEISSAPKFLRTFGTKGGIFSGTKGEVAPLKLYGIRGIGVDAKDNIYIANNGFHYHGGSDLRAFSPNGQLRWNLLGLCFVNSGDFDPASDGKILYLNAEKITLDYTKPAGQQWTYRASTLNPFKYPDDPRLSMPLETCWIRRIEGKQFMFLTDMYAQFLAVYRFDGEIAAPCAFFSIAWDGQWDKFKWMIDRRPKYKAEGGKRWMWVDRNGDGAVQSEECEIYNLGYPYVKGLDVDANGDVWVGARAITRFKNAGIDANGCLNYSVKNSEQTPCPQDGFWDVTRMKYLPENDVMFLAGGGEFPQFNTLVRYDHWSAPDRKLTYSIKLPYEKNDKIWENHIVPAGFTVVGDYLFVALVGKGPHESQRKGGNRGEILVFEVKTGKEVTFMYPGANVFFESGAVDIPYPISGTLRSNGQYVILNEDDWKAKVIMYSFTPKK